MNRDVPSRTTAERSLAAPGNPDNRPSSSQTEPDIEVPPESVAGLVWLRMLWVSRRLGRNGGGAISIEAKLSLGQVNALFDGIEEKYPPILTYEQAADLVQVAVPTLKGWFSQGRFANCVRRGKPGRVVRDLFVQQFLRDHFGINAG